MKTTVEISDTLLRRAKRLAKRRGCSLRKVIESALRNELALPEQRARRPVKTHTFGGRGLQPGLSWSDWETIQSMSYHGRGG